VSEADKIMASQHRVYGAYWVENGKIDVLVFISVHIGALNKMGNVLCKFF